MRTNSIFIAHVTEAIGSPLGGGRGRRSGPRRPTPARSRRYALGVLGVASLLLPTPTRNLWTSRRKRQRREPAPENRPPAPNPSRNATRPQHVDPGLAARRAGDGRAGEADV